MTVCGLIQAHCLGWDGAKDRSLAKLDGKLVVEHVIARLREMPMVDRIVLAVPDCKQNNIFLKIAQAGGIHCHFGPTEDVLERCTQAAEAMSATTIVHVMGQHCFIDADLLERMLFFQIRERVPYVSMSDNFSPDFAGKVYTFELLEDVSRRISCEPESNQPLHRARFFSFVESNREHFGAQVYNRDPQYSDYFQKVIRDKAGDVFRDNRISVNEAKASHISNPISESYEIAAAEISPADHVLDIACGNGHGSRILAAKARCVTAIDLDGRQISRNRRANRQPNLFYEKGNALSLPDESGSAEAITAMEFIEHLQPIDADRFLGEVRRILKPGGKAIISTPQNGNGSIPVCPHHIKEYSRAEFEALLTKYFSSVRILCSKSGGRLSEANQTGQKMLAVCQ